MCLSYKSLELVSDAQTQAKADGIDPSVHKTCLHKLSNMLELIVVIPFDVAALARVREIPFWRTQLREETQIVSPPN